MNQNEFQRVTVASKIRRQNSHNRITDAISALATEESIIDGILDEDLYQELCIVFMRCIDRFDP